MKASIIYIWLSSCLAQGISSTPTHERRTGDVSAGRPTEGSVRLSNGSTSHDGRLEIYHDGRWGTVCDDRFEDEDAQRVCFELGFYGGRVEFKGGGSGQIWLDEVQCFEGQIYLAQCSHARWGSHDCTHDEDVGITCDLNLPPTETPSPLEGSIRLMDGDGNSEASTSGRLEIHHDGLWGSVCDDAFTNTEATLVCEQLGYDEGSVASESIEGSGPIWMDEVSCNEEATQLTDCLFDGWRVHDCTHAEDVAVRCEMHPVVTGRPVRLIGGLVPSSGRLEILAGGVWGTVCDDGWGRDNTMVVCRELGFQPSGYSTSGGADDGSPIHMDEVRCEIDDEKLEDCDFQGWGRHDCDHDEDVIVHCGTTSDMNTVRLAGGSAVNSGRLEVLMEGEWGTVCDDLWSWVNTRVVCQQLGYSSGVTIDPQQTQNNLPMLPIHMDEVRCLSSDQRLEDCLYAGFGIHDCYFDENIWLRCGTVTRLSEDSLSVETTG